MTRAPLDPAALAAAVITPGGLWRAVDVAEQTGSTNSDLLAHAAGGAPEGLVLAAEEQVAGRGRLGRSWVAPPRSSLMFSMLLRPAVPRDRLGWLPLLAGVAAAEAVRAAAGPRVELKWPNDLLAPGPEGGPGKLGGILAEATGDAVVVGIGLNVSTEAGELPPPGPGALPATSLRLAGAGPLDRGELLAAILAAVDRWYRSWTAARGDAERSGLRASYTSLCATVGRQVRAEMPGDRVLSGRAGGVDQDGRLLVVTPSGGAVPIAAGDIVHLR
jgi:BirA family biotin operon repressor/biotin-[acetyl-CoA-carboxylase] ligase